MKNKKTSYFMVPIVLVIWGLIGWKVYAVVKGNTKNDLHSSQEANQKSQTKEISDTIPLIANYRDPFLNKVVIKDNSKFKIPNSKLPSAKITDSPKPISVWPKISYHGLVKRSGNEKMLGFLNVNSKSYFIQGGEEVAEIQVGKLWRDSVEIVFNKEKKVFWK